MKRRLAAATVLAFSLAPLAVWPQALAPSRGLLLVCSGVAATTTSSASETRRYLLLPDPYKRSGWALSVSTLDAPNGVGSYICDSCDQEKHADGSYRTDVVGVSDGAIRALEKLHRKRSEFEHIIYIDRFTGDVTDKQSTLETIAGKTSEFDFSFTGTCRRREPQF